MMYYLNEDKTYHACTTEEWSEQFETMVFDKVGGGTDVYMRRYTTWEQAVEGHKKAVRWVRDGCNDETR